MNNRRSISGYGEKVRHGFDRKEWVKNRKAGVFGYIHVRSARCEHGRLRGRYCGTYGMVALQ